MMTRKTAATIATLAAGSLFGLVTFAESFVGSGPTPRHAAFQMIDPSVAPPKGERLTELPSYLRGSTVAAAGEGALVIDGDSGKLLRVDGSAAVRDSIDIGPGASQLVYDGRGRAFVVDRRGDRIAIVVMGKIMRVSDEIATRTEPYGVALSPDRRTLLVTTVADRQLTAYDASTGEERWSVAIGPEPRGVAISPDGSEAMITFLNTSAVARLDLEDEAPSPDFVALDRRAPTGTGVPAAQQRPQSGASFGGMPATATNGGQSFSRAAFTATYVSTDMAIVPHQESTPVMATTGFENTGVYGGGSGFAKPIEHRLAFVRRSESGFEKLAKANLDLHMPRAVAYDARRDIAYLAGYGSDEVYALGDASRPSVHLKWSRAVSSAAEPCGPSGLDIAEDGSLLVFCGLSRKLATIAAVDDRGSTKLVMSDALAESRLSAAAQRGRALFRSGKNVRLSTQGAMACESCHPEGRADGLSWRIGGNTLQTPLLAGRVLGTHPFKWDGGDENIQVSLRSTVTRLGGSGISKEQAADIAAFLDELPRPRAPSPEDPEAVARGNKLFHSKKLGCASCHRGVKLTDRKRYDLADDLDKVDTPSLIGLAISAPYYHDGSASTLRALLLENGSIHGMGNVGDLQDREMDDLIAYLQTL